MRSNSLMKIPMPALALSLMIGLAACAGTDSMPTTHPEEVGAAPVCSECHSEWQSAYDHTGDYARSHRFYASRDQRVCLTCHSESFCSECHGYEVELKPSDIHKDSPGRELPHRGDYLTQHKIDGRINPASCYKCHGRRNDWRCKECHR